MLTPSQIKKIQYISEKYRIPGSQVIDNMITSYRGKMNKQESQDKARTEHYELAEYLRQKISQCSTNSYVKPTQLKYWADTFRIMTDKDKRDTNFIKTLIDKIFCDSVWLYIIRSAEGIRKNLDKGNFDRLLNIKTTKKEIDVSSVDANKLF